MDRSHYNPVTEVTTRQRLKYWFWNRQYYLVIIIPVFFCWLPIIFNNPIGYTAYTIIIMAFFWCLELVPLAVTALLPMVFFPLFGVLKSDDVSKQYFKNVNVLIFGGLMMAIAIERWNLHRRIALKVLLMVGTKPVWLMFGFMSSTAFLSMWMSNTATTAMMIPIANAVLAQLDEDPEEDLEERTELNQTKNESLINENSEGNLGYGGIPETGNDVKLDDKNQVLKEVSTFRTTANYCPLENRKLQYQRMCKGITLCVPYAANIGGTATVTGTAPNLVLVNQIDSLYGPEANVSFGTWMILSLPGTLICLFLCWIWLAFVYLDSFKFWRQKTQQSEKEGRKAREVIQGQYDALGPMRFVADSTTVIVLCMALFCFPSKPLGFMCRSTPEYFPRTKEEETFHRKKKTVPALLNWKIVEQKMAWEVLFLMGGGAAMAEGCKVSGLSAWLGEVLTVFGSLSAGFMTLLISFVVAAFTEITSNTATATILLPIFAELATVLGVNPLYVMITATWACSYAFMLPVATPPNAIAFSHGTIKVMDMVKTGSILNIVCVLVANFTINTFGIWIFDVKTFPGWANSAVPSVPPTPNVLNCTEYFQNM